MADTCSRERRRWQCQGQADGLVHQGREQQDPSDHLLWRQGRCESPAHARLDQALVSDRLQETNIALHAGSRGPTVLEDFHNREKISKFDHERIPERAVHARGAGAFGEFELHTPLTGLTTAKVSLRLSQRSSSVAGG